MNTVVVVAITPRRNARRVVGCVLYEARTICRVDLFVGVDDDVTFVVFPIIPTLTNAMLNVDVRCEVLNGEIGE